MRVEKVNFIPPIKLYTSEYNRNFPQEKVFFSEKMSDKKKREKIRSRGSARERKGEAQKPFFLLSLFFFFLPRAYIFSPSIIFKIRR